MRFGRNKTQPLSQTARENLATAVRIHAESAEYLEKFHRALNPDDGLATEAIRNARRNLADALDRLKGAHAVMLSGSMSSPNDPGAMAIRSARVDVETAEAALDAIRIARGKVDTARDGAEQTFMATAAILLDQAVAILREG